MQLIGTVEAKFGRFPLFYAKFCYQNFYVVQLRSRVLSLGVLLCEIFCLVSALSWV